VLKQPDKQKASNPNFFLTIRSNLLNQWGLSESRGVVYWVRFTAAETFSRSSARCWTGVGVAAIGMVWSPIRT
jgi:hypothetical protein